MILKKSQDFEFKPFRFEFVTEKETADLILSTEKNNLFDFLSVGTYCLHQLITTDSNEKVVKIFLRDFSKTSSGITAYLEKNITIGPFEVPCCQKFELPNTSYFYTACTYTEVIANFILGTQYIHNMVLGALMAPEIVNHVYGFSENDFLEIALPKEFNVFDAVSAEKLIWKLISEALEYQAEVIDFNLNLDKQQ